MLGLDPAPAERAHEAVEQLAGPRLDERAGALDVRGRDERVDGGRAEGGVDLLLDRRANPPFDVGAQLGERVELARGARELVVELRQHLLVDVLDGDVDRGAGLVRELVRRPPSSPPRSRRSAPASISSTSRPEPSSTTVSDCASPDGLTQVDDERVAGLRAGRSSAGTSSATRLAQRLELLIDELLRDLGLGARHLERRPVDDLRRRLHLDGGRERPRLVVGRRQLEVVLGR